jgi:hypothetical protein
MTTTNPHTDTQVMNGADILVKSLVDHGVEIIFAYPGGASMPLHQALTRYADKIRTSRGALSPPKAMPAPRGNPESAWPPAARVPPIW